MLSTATAVAESTVNSDAGRLPAKTLAVSGHEAQAESLDSVFCCGSSGLFSVPSSCQATDLTSVALEGEGVIPSASLPSPVTRVRMTPALLAPVA